ncbi:MAG: hypothetical protein Ta2D_03570 [Rickettsiales bacterium]|nr:MAG: hypothetical protein Ta2D_03570 [Rickettsiales bacterium]
MAEMILKLNNNIFNTINKIVSLQGINLKDYLFLPAKNTNAKTKNTSTNAKIKNIEKTENFDLSPIELSQFTINNKTLKFNTPISFTPKLNKTKDLMLVEDKQFDILVGAYNRDDLFEELKDYIFCIWEGYAKNEQKMDKSAQNLKQLLLKNIVEC